MMRRLSQLQSNYRDAFSDEEIFLVLGNPMESVLDLSYYLGADDLKIWSESFGGNI